MKKILRDSSLEIVSQEDLEFKKSIYSRNQKVRFICYDCNKKIVAQIRHINSFPLICGKCKIVRTNLKNCGYRSNLLTPDMREKIKKAAHTKEANKKRSSSINYKKTQIKREEYYRSLGVKTNLQLDENKIKTRKTCQEKYGTNWTTTKESLEKSKKTCQKKYGVDFVFQSKEFKEKSKKTLMKKYGVDNAMKSTSIISKSRKRYFYKNTYFDSSWELAFFIWLKEKDIEFEYHPQVCFFYFGNKRYFPDFKIGDDFIEIKGNQFFKNGEFIDFYNREKNNDMYRAKYQCMLDNKIKILTLDNIKESIDFCKKTFKNFPKCFKC